jgi:hypothetical protein
MTNQEQVRVYNDAVRDMTDLIEEMFVTNRVTLLSPVLQRLTAEKARQVREMHDRIAIYLEVPEFIKIGEKDATSKND